MLQGTAVSGQSLIGQYNQLVKAAFTAPPEAHQHDGLNDTVTFHSSDQSTAKVVVGPDSATVEMQPGKPAEGQEQPARTVIAHTPGLDVVAAVTTQEPESATTTGYRISPDGKIVFEMTEPGAQLDQPDASLEGTSRDQKDIKDLSSTLRSIPADDWSRAPVSPLAGNTYPVLFQGAPATLNYVPATKQEPQPSVTIHTTLQTTNKGSADSEFQLSTGGPIHVERDLWRCGYEDYTLALKMSDADLQSLRAGTTQI